MSECGAPVIYLAGCMRGKPFFNFPRFDAAEFFLLSVFPEAVIHNPATHDRVQHQLDEYKYPTGDYSDQGWSPERINAFLRDAMQWDLSRICESTHIALIPGWEHSRGVAVELGLARLLGLHEIHLSERQLERV